ncbi:hypothetical protein DMC47_08845 [Nostoc sp. 3335mG]|nr:hypothetical protein DMC47_08845 [Nostoc sp. 3335mG]
MSRCRWRGWQVSAYEADEDRFQVPLMFAFRDASRKGDARRKVDEEASGERVLAERTLLHRRGAAEATLRADLSHDLIDLMDTFNLASIRNLGQTPYTAASVLNFGLADYTSVSTDSLAMEELAAQLRRSLLAHEPRLRPETLTVERRRDDDDRLNGRMRFMIVAEMRANPVDVPVEFVAEVDVGAGKMALPGLAGTA